MNNPVHGFFFEIAKAKSKILKYEEIKVTLYPIILCIWIKSLHFHEDDVNLTQILTDAKNVKELLL